MGGFGAVAPLTRPCSTVYIVRRVGIRELRQNLSGYLAEVKAGSAFTVTDRGKRIALLKPHATEDETWQRLVDDGVVVPARGTWADIEPPSKEFDSDRTASRYLQEMREDRI